MLHRVSPKSCYELSSLEKAKADLVSPIPVPGETKVWQYITLMKRIYLIDCRKHKILLFLPFCGVSGGGTRRKDPLKTYFFVSEADFMAAGICPPNPKDTTEDILLRGVVRVENVEHPEQYIDAILSRTKQRYIEKTYDVRGYEKATEFLELLARKGSIHFLLITPPPRSCWLTIEQAVNY